MTDDYEEIRQSLVGLLSEPDRLAAPVSVLLACLKDHKNHNALARWSAAWALMGMGLDKIEKIEDRVLCLVYLGEVDKLAEIGEPAVPALVGLLKNKEARSTAIKALAKMGLPAVPALAGCLKDEDELVRSIAGGALLKMGSFAVPVLVRCMRAGEGATHRIAKVLERIGIDKIEKIEDRVFCLFVLGKSEEVVKLGGAAVPALAGWLRHGDQLRRKMAAETLLQIGLDELRRLGIEEQVLCLLAMEKRDEVVKLGVIAVPALVASLRQKDWVVQINAAQALRPIAAAHPQYDWREAVPALVDVFKDAKGGSRVRMEAIGALVALVDIHTECDWKNVVPALIGCLNAEGELPFTAARSLLKIAADKMTTKELALCLLVLRETGEIVLMGAAAVPPLAEILKAADAGSRNYATDVLVKIAKETRIDLRQVEAALKGYVDSVRKKDDPVSLRKATKEATERYLKISNVVRERLVKEDSGIGGILLEGERPRPPSGRNGMYRCGKEARAFA